LYSRAEIEGAESSRTLQARIGWPSDHEFKEALSSPGTLYNSHLTADDVTRAFHIFGGRARELIKGKEVLRKKKLFDNIQRIQIPAPLLQKHKFDDLDIYFMFCNRKPFLVTLSRNILFQPLQSFHRISKVNKKSNRVTYQHGKRDIVAGINKVLHMYGGPGINIENVHADNEFAKIRDDINSNLICCAVNEHVERIERRIRLIKERNRYYWLNLPYAKAPKVMIDENLFDINEWLNAYPKNNGISRKYSPAAIVQGKGPVNVDTLTVTFGAYCEVYKTTIRHAPSPKVIDHILLNST